MFLRWMNFSREPLNFATICLGVLYVKLVIRVSSHAAQRRPGEIMNENRDPQNQPSKGRGSRRLHWTC